MHQSSIIVKNVSIKLQGNTVLDDISFELNDQQHLAITGNSGSGKTLLAKALSDQIFYTGEIDIYSGDESGFKPKIIFTQQHYHFKNLSNVSDFYYQQRYNSFDSADTCTVFDELKLIDISEQNIDHWLKKFNLYHRKHTPLLQLSSGEHKRFQLVKAFLSQPNILILDNPFVGVDADTRILIQQILNEVSGEIKLIVITSGDEIPECITHVLELENGKIKSFGKKEDFKHQSKFQNQHVIAIDKIPVSSKNLSFANAVKMINVNVQYGSKKVLQNINWQVKRGECWLLKGSNGAGKSTLLSLVTGDNPKAYSNEIYLFDKRRGSGESIWDIKKNIGFVSPELEWYFEKNICCFDVVASGFFDTIGLFKHISPEQQSRVNEWMDVLNIAHLKTKLLSSVSAGMQRIGLLARALVKDPSLLILDEPCQGLDKDQTAYFVSLINSLCTQLNKTLIYVSHYENEIPECIDNCLNLDLTDDKIMRKNRNSKFVKSLIETNEEVEA